MEQNWYTLSRKWFDFAFDNPEKINCNHTALYFFIVDKWNRLWKKDKFWLPTIFTMEALQIKSKNTFYKLFNDLIEFWFIEIIEKSVNQNTSNIIKLNSAVSKNKSALDLATIQQISQQEDSTISSTGNINKQYNNITNKQINKENIKEIIQELYPTSYKTTSIFFENLLLSNIDLQEELTKDFIDKIYKKLKEVFDIRTDLDNNSYIWELIKFIEHHSYERSEFKSTVARINTWFIINHNKKWKK